MKHILLLIFVSGLIAQDFDHPERDHERSEKMEMMMVWKLTDELDLSPEQAEKFFPRLRKHRNELDEVKKMERALAGEMRKKMGEDEDLSGKDVKNTVKKATELRKEVVDLESKFLLGMDDILSPRQLAILGMFKQKMMRNIRGELKEHHGKEGKRGKNMGRRGGKKRRGF
ncbi:MAG: periplasmic heavy metal sensor [Candidatus Marinimicrobia bacterium]|nr:periplasmic heavy metal sensor [Candidatus Neomarinimicrobiota bacterium]